jgi:membrane fusion protein (multidrug efflux system)
MAKRLILVLAIMAVLITALGYSKFRQVQTAAHAAGFQPAPESVTTVRARQEQWPATLSVVGNTVAVHGVTVSADLPGTVARIAFESGKPVREGDVLVELDTREERAQLASAEAQRDLAKVTYAREKELVDQGVISRVEYDQATAQQKQTEARVAELRATIARKTIRAPFSGLLGIRQVNLGQYLAAGNAIVPLQSVDPIYVNFGVPQQMTGQVRVGSIVRINAAELGGARFTGRVTAINSLVDESTRNIQVQATLANTGRRLRPGMFVDVEAITGASRQVVPLPASAIAYAPYGDSVFIVTDMKSPAGQPYRGVRQQFVKLEGSRGDQVAVVSGLAAGDEVVTSGAFKLRPGAAVTVDNKVLPANSSKPNPEDN